MNYQQTKQFYQDYPFFRTHQKWLHCTIKKWAWHYSRNSNGLFTYRDAVDEGWWAVHSVIDKIKKHTAERSMVNYLTRAIRWRIINGLNRHIKKNKRYNFIGKIEEKF